MASLGVKHPRRVRLSRDDIARIRQLRSEGAFYYDIAKRFSVSTTTVFNHCVDLPTPKPQKRVA